nr:unnamed protein product [Digitaria exilis]
MENQKRLSFSIPSNPRRLTFRARPAAAAPTLHACPAFHHRVRPLRNPNPHRGGGGARIDFTAAESGDANPSSIACSSNIAYGLNKSKKATSCADLMRLRFK